MGAISHFSPGLSLERRLPLRTVSGSQVRSRTRLNWRLIAALGANGVAWAAILFAAKTCI